MTIYGCAFISKEGIKKTPVFGSIAQGLQSIFVNRNDPNSRKEVLDKILERQKDYMEGKAVLPLMIFPEGTTTSGRHILKFKKGAFYALLPIKPNIIHPNIIRNLHLGCGASDVNINYARTLTELYVQTEYIELPIMTPNEYMYTNFASYGKEKWEIYAEVAREIMCSLGDFKKSDKDLKDSFRYIHILENHTYVEKEKFKMD
jgi:lysophosphatidylcholine acyltransferase/lyso-PAF acetyltransferase